MLLPKNSKPALAFQSGVLYDNYKKNQDSIAEHTRSISHANIISNLQNIAAKRQRSSFLIDEQIEESRNEKYLEVTARMIRTVYVVNKLSLPFSDHRALVTLQKLNGLNLGYHHYERSSCTRMTNDISNHMHETLIENLIKSQMPISVIVDDTTDAGNVHYKIVYFQTVEDVSPVIYFYKIIQLKSGTGFGGFETMRLSWESEKKPEFYQYMQENLVGFASDGASTNLGKTSGTVKYLKDWAKKPIFAIHCMSHRLELAIQHAFDQLIQFDDNKKIISEYLDETINKVYKFYNAQGSKRITHLKQTCDKHMEKFYSLSRIIQIRWIASDYKAMKAVNSMWNMLVEDLNTIGNDNEFDAKTKNKAIQLSTRLTGKYFLILFNFLFDIINELSVLSQDMQKRTSLIIDFHSFKKKFEDIFTHLKNQNGRYLQLFLDEARCESDMHEIERCSNLDQYIRSNKIIYKNIIIYNDQDDIPEINEYRTRLLDMLLSEFEKYFPDGDLKNYDALDPMNMPKPDDYVSARTYGIIKIKELNNYFQIGDESTVLNEWQKLLESVVTSPNYCQIKNSRTSAFAFWSQLLKWPEIDWSSNIKRLIYTVLAIPISSAEAERGFSSLKYIRDTHRSRLTPTNLDAIMRIKLNGPDELDYFAAAKYARKWINGGNYPTDSKAGMRKEESISHSLLEEENIEMQKKYLLKSTIF